MARSYDIEQGFNVYGSDSKKIGSVKYCTDTYCQMDTGFLGLGPDYYFPLDAVRDVTGNDVYLNVPSDRIRDLGWDREPTRTTTGTMGGTMPRQEGWRGETTEGRRGYSQRYSDIQNGFNVYGSDNRKIGTVQDCTNTYCRMDTGFLGLGGDHFFPLDAVRDVSGNDVYLNVPSDRIKDWDHEPTGSTMGGTMPWREGTSGTATGETRSMPLREEELSAQRYREQAGEVEIGKHVVEQERTIDVPVSHEEVSVRQRPADRPANEPIGEGETFRVPVTEEHVDVEKQPHVYGEVEVEKRRVTENQPFTETVRKEVPDVRKKGDVKDVVDEDLTDEERRRRDRDR